MKDNDFIARSPAAKEALKSANLLKSLNTSALIEGPLGAGKLTLARYILPYGVGIGDDDIETLSYSPEMDNGIIVKDFHKLTQYGKLESWLKEHPVRMIATAAEPLSDSILDTFFSIRVYLPSLKERQEDVQPLAKKFLKEAQGILGIGMEKEIKPDRLILDLKDNCHSLRRSIFFTFLMDNIGENEIMIMMENYLMKHIGGNNDYRDHLYLYEAPLIRAGMKQFKSQLQLAEKLGLNRNTLRKKINDMKDLL